MPSPTETELRNLAAQLGCPSGEMGVEVGHKLHEINHPMTLNTFKCLRVKTGEKLLEIGHGNCSHLPLLLIEVPGFHYTGLEISDVMTTEAERINAHLVQSETAHFHHYSGESIPFEDQSFNHVMTVNTIYFWPDPLKMLSEIKRVTRGGGKISIGFGKAEYMKQMPVTQFGFNLFNSAMVEELLHDSGFRNLETSGFKEPVQGYTDAVSDREYAVVSGMV